MGGKRLQERGGYAAAWSYGIAVLLSLLVALASVIAHPLLARAPFLLPAIAILFSAYLGGLGPGLLATLVCSALAAAIFLTPPDASVLRDWPYLVRFAIVVIGGALASLLMGALRRASARAEQAAAESARLYQEATTARLEALAQSQQLQTVLAGILDGVTAQAPDGSLLYANEAAAHLTGFDTAAQMLATPPEEILGRFSILDEQGQPFPIDRLPGRAALRGETPPPALLRYRSKASDEEHWVRLTSRALHDKSGNVQMAINVMHDVTAEKQMEEQKAEFLAALAHDLKTPITAIKGAGQLMLRRLAADGQADASWLQDELRRLNLTAERMTSLLGELLDIQDLGSAQGIELARSSFNLAELVRQVASELTSLTTIHHIEVQTPDEPVIGCWDSDRLGRVLANLIENAIKYSPGGGAIAVDLRSEANTACITIHDQGIGIPEGELARIFERFQRGSNVPGHISGTGVGLTYARWVVAQHGGQLRVESAPSTGSCFAIELPVGTAADAA